MLHNILASFFIFNIVKFKHLLSIFVLNRWHCELAHFACKIDGLTRMIILTLKNNYLNAFIVSLK